MKIVILSGKHKSTNIFFNAIKKDFAVEKIIIEKSVPYKVLLRRRIRKLGLIKVCGQVLFKILVEPGLIKATEGRRQVLWQQFGFDDSPIDGAKVIQVESVNSDEAIKALKEIGPDIVLVNGTRIISQKVLESTRAIFINTHIGITPTYRGSHGGYWALAEGKPQLCGVTIHRVDKGIDTGQVIDQAVVSPGPNDNYLSLPLLQLGAAFPLLEKALKHFEETGELPSKKPLSNDSGLYSHPTIWGYLYRRYFKAIK